MIGESREQTNGHSKSIIALRDALVIFFIVLFSNLLVNGYPPTLALVYGAAIAAALTALTSYAHARGITAPKKAEA